MLGTQLYITGPDVAQAPTAVCIYNNPRISGSCVTHDNAAESTLLKPPGY